MIEDIIDFLSGLDPDILDGVDPDILDGVDSDMLTQDFDSVDLSMENSLDQSDWGIDDDIDELQERASGIGREGQGKNITFKRLNCATRHGCSGATDCNYAYANYPG